MKTFAALAPVDFEKDLQKQLQILKLNVLENHGRLFIFNLDGLDSAAHAENVLQKISWAQQLWLNPVKYQFESISQAAKTLKELAPMWSLYGHQHFRRAQLIQEQLRTFKPKPVQFGENKKMPPLGAWTLVDEKTMWASPQTNSPHPLGEFNFVEDKEAPSRAYLKLYDAFTNYDLQPPTASEVCLELGSSPGGWTWVLNQFGCKIISVDRAPLREDLMAQPKIKHLIGDAFKISVKDTGPIDWLFSDLICYPAKLHELVEQWIVESPVKNMVCTLKFQGPTDFEAIKAFQQMPGSRLVHLHHNKHELTWIWQRL